MNATFSHDLAVLIGRFQPFHRGHAALLARALETAPQVAVVLGSSLRAPSARNPFSWEARADMIRQTLDAPSRSRLQFIPMRDYYDTPRWSKAVRQQVNDAFPGSPRTALVGHIKDALGGYQRLFPEWTFVAAGQQGEVSATQVRSLLFSDPIPEDLETRLLEWVPTEVCAGLRAWRDTPTFAALREEYAAIEAGRRTWGTGPFVTVDAVVCAAGHVLLVCRGRCPGKGLWALPGGFLDAHERLQEGALRELLEETTLDLSDPRWGARLCGTQVFDHPERSQRGRTLTHAHWFELPAQTPLPAVQGADDAAEARWVPLPDLPGMEGQLFEDHFHILDHFLNLLPH